MKAAAVSVKIKPVDPENENQRIMKPLNAAELKQWFDEKRDFCIIDVREPWEHDIVQISGARLIPFRQLRPPLDGCPPDRPVVIFCHHGTRSLIAAKILEKNGYTNVYNLVGGINRYAQEADTSLKRY